MLNTDLIQEQFIEKENNGYSGMPRGSGKTKLMCCEIIGQAEVGNIKDIYCLSKYRHYLNDHFIRELVCTIIDYGYSFMRRPNQIFIKKLGVKFHFLTINDNKYLFSGIDPNSLVFWCDYVEGETTLTINEIFPLLCGVVDVEKIESLFREKNLKNGVV